MQADFWLEELVPFSKISNSIGKAAMGKKSSTVLGKYQIPIRHLSDNAE